MSKFNRNSHHARTQRVFDDIDELRRERLARPAVAPAVQRELESLMTASAPPEDALLSAAAAPVAPAAPVASAAPVAVPAAPVSDAPTENPLVAIFMASDIRVRGTVNEPLFCAMDVAKRINDSHYKRTLAQYDARYRVTEHVANSVGKGNLHLFLTEAGLYKYLLQSRRPEAEPFQVYVYELLKVERRRVVDAALFEAKIARQREQDVRAAATHIARRLHAAADDVKYAVFRAQQAEAEFNYQKTADSSLADYIEYCETRIQQAGADVPSNARSILEPHFRAGTCYDGYNELYELALS